MNNIPLISVTIIALDLRRNIFQKYQVRINPFFEKRKLSVA